MIGKVPPRPIKPGDELTTKWLNSVLKAAMEGSIASLGYGLKGSPSPTGWSIGLAGVTPNNHGFLAKTDGAITARVTTTLGEGDVFLTTISGTTITVETDTVHVLNFGGAIATGRYVWVESDAEGNLFITAEEC